ncbi:three-Cys-motif partner protein TcmP [Amycolatopsis sp. 195334CR]|uniref:three-Cys-motif partner protein TcmP n=1 Tax=Amycolatopsis sp. 195334CR TaxID=2814588 RepID=UPI001A8F5B84|nr:three-Cys-motif partner protein TcmP [Amycolatopsis sp. 195334CR]MBN6035533.1 three-Cys-motif partner protein TcmP [Amycolatopsis sp. 195334CR]
MDKGDQLVSPEEPRIEGDATADELFDYALAGETAGETSVEAGVDRDAFFVSKKAAAVFKHSLLKSYFPRFAGKTGSTELNKRLVYVDTHAGPGKYEDDTPGSPLLIAENVTGMLGASGRAHRDIACMFVEARPSHYRHLTEVLEEHMPLNALWKTRRGKASTYLAEALEFAADSPLFMFIDPYGLGPSFDEVVRILARPRTGRGSKTEILLNFISMAFSRAGGYLKVSEPTRQQLTTLERLDTVLGGDWWREIYLSSSSGGSAVSKLAQEYATRVCNAVDHRPRSGVRQRCRATLIPVRNTLEQDVPVYWLVHFTFHPHGAWCMAEAAAKANLAWRHTNHQLSLMKALTQDTGQGDLFGELLPQASEDTRARAEEKLQQQWLDIITGNLLRLVGTRPQLDVCDDMAEIFGATLGLAHGKHLRKAWDQLADEGVLIGRDRRKPLENQMIRRARLD